MGQIHHLASTKPYNIQVKTNSCIIQNEYAEHSSNKYLYAMSMHVMTSADYQTILSLAYGFRPHPDYMSD